MSGLPEGWELTTLGDCLFSVIGGGTPSRKNSEYFHGDIPWFTVKDMKSLKPNEAQEHISTKAISESATNLIPAHTLIIATRIALGKIIRPTVACAINQDLKALFTGTGVNPDFLLYWVVAHAREIQEKGSGTTVSGIRLETLNSLSLNLPPAREQTRIVEKLEELLSDLDAGVAELNVAQKKLVQYRQSLLKAAVEGKLTQHWREQRSAPSPSPQPLSHQGRGAYGVDGVNDAAASYQPQHSEKNAATLQQNPNLRNAPPSKTLPSPLVGEGPGERGQEQPMPFETGAQLLERILTERRARWEAKQLAKFKEQGKAPPKDWQSKYPEPVKPDTTDLAELPEGWVWASVEQLGHVRLGRQRSPSKVGKANPTPYIRAANITEGGVDLSDVLEMDFSETEKETFALKVGDVLLTEASGSPEHVGRPAIWKHAAGLYCFQNTVLRFSPLGIDSEYPYYLFLAMQKLGVFSKLSGGVGINHLSAGKFSKLPVPLPPLAEQQELIESVKQKFSSCDQQQKFNAHSLKQSAAQRKNILKAAFSGQLVPQDPNDEPASELLERIHAERCVHNASKIPLGRKRKGLV